MCEGVSLNKVKSSSYVSRLPSDQEAGCIFVTDIVNIMGGNNSTINGLLPSPSGAEWRCGDGSASEWLNTPCSGHLPPKVDGGYYIAYKAWDNTNYTVLQAINAYGNSLHPNCEAAK
jgi:hypothetical protein